MNSARSNSGYNFRPLLAGLDEWVAGADLSLCHMEVPVAPAGKKITTYPIFGTTPDLVRDLAAQGWSGCSTASNHSVDRGFAGVVETLQTFEKYGLGHVGTARSAKEAAAPQWYTVTVNNTATRIAHFSASYGTNGMPVDPDKPWSIQLLDAKQLISHAREARKAGADLVLVSVHDGAEYVTEPTASQRSIAKALADSGAVDLMIGHHAHVPQPLAKLPGGPGGNGMWVAYGLGNMLSNQDQACCVANTANGLLLLATVSKAPSGPAQITQFEWVATTVDRKAGHRLSALADLSGSKSGSLSAAEIAKRYELVRKAAGSQVPERTTPPEQQESAVTVSKRPPGITPEP